MEEKQGAVDVTDFSQFTREAIEAEMSGALEASSSSKKKKGTQEAVRDTLRKGRLAKESNSGWVTEPSLSEELNETETSFFEPPLPLPPPPAPAQSIPSKRGGGGGGKRGGSSGYGGAASSVPDPELERKRELLKKYDTLTDKFGLPKAKLDIHNDIWMLEAELDRVNEKVSIIKGHSLIKETIFTLGDVAEQISAANPSVGVNLKGYKEALRQQESKLDGVVAELCIKYAYLFTEIKPEWQLGFILATTAVAVHAANSRPELFQRVQSAERARGRGGEKVPDMSKDFSAL